MKYMHVCVLLIVLALAILMAGCSKTAVAPVRQTATPNTIAQNEEQELQANPNMNPQAKAMLEADIAREKAYAAGQAPTGPTAAKKP